MRADEATDYLHSLKRFGKKPGLKAITALLDRLGNPQKKLKFIHVAGTNGKGSTCAYISNILRTAGYKTGLFISPFVNVFNERIQINGQNISDSDLAHFTDMVKEAIGTDLSPTEFDAVTAVGLLYFAHMQCDYVVLEVGLGGRFDSTNVIDSPAAAVITSISLDHTKVLGDTVEKIAFEKCGIIKNGCRVIACCDNPVSVNDIIMSEAAKKGCPLIICDKNDINAKIYDIENTVFEYKNERYEISMTGEHQIYNAVTAIETARALKIADRYIKKGLKDTQFYGRFQIISKNPKIIIDGAHNYSGVLAFKDTLLKYFPNDDFVIVMGMLKDKEYEKCVNEIAPLAKLFIATEPDNPRKVSADDLAAAARKNNTNVITAKNRDEAVKIALENKNSTVCICGSLYLIGNISTIATCK